MADADQSRRWWETRLLAAAVLTTGALLILLFVALAAPADNDGGYPTGLVFATTGLPVVLILLVFSFARRQDIIDRRHGLFED
ncbi:MAG: DUF4212 domain-containing protein [Hyphomicrobiales bacterium]|nr:DUF4212 domain-containing protein [Hyphomicrobiales bacterium]